LVITENFIASHLLLHLCSKENKIKNHPDSFQNSNENSPVNIKLAFPLRIAQKGSYFFTLGLHPPAKDWHRAFYNAKIPT